MNHVQKALTFGFFIVLSFFITVSNTYASEIITTRQLMQLESGEQVKSELRDMLSREDFRKQLINNGVDPESASQRIASLTDREAKQLASQFEDLPAAGSALTVLLLVVIIVLLVN